jgi:hypothetical protein
MLSRLEIVESWARLVDAAINIFNYLTGAQERQRLREENEYLRSALSDERVRNQVLDIRILELQNYLTELVSDDEEETVEGGSSAEE